MRKTLIIIGILLLIIAVVLAALGLQARTMFYGIMDAPYSYYGKYGVYMRRYFAAAVVTGVTGVVCVILGITLK